MSRPEQPFNQRAETLIAAFKGVPARRLDRRGKAVQTIGELMPKILKKCRVQPDAPEHVLRNRWEEIVGAANSSYSYPARLENGRLLVLCSHPVVRNELFLHRAGILERIRKIPGFHDIRSIRLATG